MKLFNSLLVPIDNSKEAEDMLKYVAMFCVKYDSKITLLHTIKLSYLAKYSSNIPTFVSLEKLMKSEIYHKIKEDYYKNHVKPLLDKAVDILVKNGVNEHNIILKVREGFPAEEIVKEAEEEDYSCMFIKRGVDKDSIAKTTEKVIHTCYKLPIFVFGYRGIKEKKTVESILVPFNNTKHSIEALKVAKTIQETFNSKVTILNVNNEDESDISANVGKYLKKFEIIFRSGDVVEEIVEEVLSKNYDLVIFGRRCPSLKKTLFGSISENVTKKIKETPVCLVTYCRE